MAGEHSYRAVGQAMRRAFAAAFLADPPLTQLEWRTLAAVVTFTGTFSRLDDRMYISQLARVVYGVERKEALRDWQVRKTSDAFHSLQGRGILGLEQRIGAGRRQMSLISDKGPETGPLSERVDAFVASVFGDKGPETGPLSENGDDKKGPSSVQKGASSDQKRGLGAGPSPRVPRSKPGSAHARKDNPEDHGGRHERVKNDCTNCVGGHVLNESDEAVPCPVCRPEQAS